MTKCVCEGGKSKPGRSKGMDQQDQAKWSENIHFRWPGP